MAAEAYVIRAARVEEAQLLSELALRSKAHWGYSPAFIETCRAELSYSPEQMASKQMRFFVLERAASVVGFYALRRQDGETMELEALFVEPKFIGQGFGRALMEHAKSIASGMGAIQIIIQGDPNAEGFYVTAGGVLTGRKESGSIPGRFLPTFAIDLSGNHEA